VVDELIQKGADPKTASKAGFAPIIFASQKGEPKTVARLLAAGADANYKLPVGVSVLFVAVTNGRTKAAELLLDSGAEPNAADKTGNTPLHVAAQAGNLEIVNKLIAKGANPNLRTAKAPTGRGNGFFRAVGEQTPLFLAARANHEAVMRALVAAGADPKLKPQDNSTILMAAAGSGHVEVVRYAYELDPDIKAVNDRKSTVMHASVLGSMQNSTQPEVCKVVQFLAEKGADLDLADANGRTPIMIADLLPIDKAVDLLTQLIKQSGGTPKVATKR
jgi:ankyrin repeat protein